MPITDGSSQALVGKLGIFVGVDYIGKVEFIFNKTIPAGKIPAFGTEYSRTTYNKLWEEVQRHPDWMLTETAWQEFYASHNGQVPYYSDGDGSTTFRVPRLTGFPEGAGSLEEVGAVKEAGIPNITGTAYLGGAVLEAGKYGVSANAYDHSALYPAYDSVKSEGLVSGSDGGNIGLDASRISSIYGKSDTVQPPSIVGMWVITAFVAVTSISSTALDNIVSGVTELETRLGKVETTNNQMIDYVIERGGNVTQWYEIYKSGKLVCGGKEYRTTPNTVTFLKAFKEKPLVLRGIMMTQPMQLYDGVAYRNLTTTSVYFPIDANLPENNWLAIGEIQE